MASGRLVHVVKLFLGKKRPKSSGLFCIGSWTLRSFPNGIFATHLALLSSCERSVALWNEIDPLTRYEETLCFFPALVSSFETLRGENALSQTVVLIDVTSLNERMLNLFDKVRYTAKDWGINFTSFHFHISTIERKLLAFLISLSVVII